MAQQRSSFETRLSLDEKIPKPSDDEKSSRLSFVGEVGEPLVMSIVSRLESFQFAIMKLTGAHEPVLICQGSVKNIGVKDMVSTIKVLVNEKVENDLELEYPCANHAAGLSKVFEVLGSMKKELSVENIKVVGHRVVHGGGHFDSAAAIDEDVIAKIEEATVLGPQHNPGNLVGIRAAQEIFSCKQVAVFDTSFHHSIEPKNYLYAIPQKMCEEMGIRRYGFHGYSFSNVLRVVAKQLNRLPTSLNLVICHLSANGCSLAAVMNGKCVNTSMGLTPLEGLVMSTRCGDIDPSLFHHLKEITGDHLRDIDDLLANKSGLLGLCGMSDMSMIEERAEKGEESFVLARDVFIQRARKYLGAYLVELGGVADAIVFTSDIGERCWTVRRGILEHLEGLGIALDEGKNERARGQDKDIAFIHHATSRVKILVVKEDVHSSIIKDACEVCQVKAKMDTKIKQVRRTSLYTSTRNSLDGDSMTRRTSIDAVTGKPRELRSAYFLPLDDSPQRLIPLGILQQLLRLVGSRIGYFMPVRPAHKGDNMQLVKDVLELGGSVDDMHGVTFEKFHDMMNKGQQEDLMDIVVEKYEKYKKGKSFVLIAGTHLDKDSDQMNNMMAKLLQAPVILFHSMFNTTVNSVMEDIKFYLNQAKEQEVDVQSVMINRIPRETFEEDVDALTPAIHNLGLEVAGLLPINPDLTAIQCLEVVQALEAWVLYGADQLEHNIQSVFFATSDVPHALEYLSKHPSTLVVMDSRRTDLLLAILLSAKSASFRPPAGILITQGKLIDPSTVQLLNGLGALVSTPVMAINERIDQIITNLKEIRPKAEKGSTAKIDAIFQMCEEHMNTEYVSALASQTQDRLVTPKVFQFHCMSQARAKPQHIVLPEGDDERVVRAAAQLVKRQLAKITMMGDVSKMTEMAMRLSVPLDGINLLDPTTDEKKDYYIEQLFECRKSKGMTMEKAAELILDPNYFGTMMMYCGEADGMVSGACHTTADTMRPALQIIKTAPGCALVSSVFFMLLPDQVYVYGDCAINVDPDSKAVANIAVSSAGTAAAFGIQPRVALLSYATGSGDSTSTKMEEAAQMAHEMAPETPIEGPMQFDTATDEDVAALKLKGKPSEVAGKANVCIFPDLNAGNNTYKAVQQSSGCIAMGPIMQGLRKPVNDLSRGCTVDDIVNTVVLTAIQALQAKDA